jgi:hypothetical protein
MRRAWHRFLTCSAGAIALTAAFALCAAASAAEPKFKHEPFVPTDPIMPLSKVRPGMTGDCLTVVKGTQVTSFRAEVIDVVRTGGNPQNLILIRVSGPVVDATGGIASGMSGSPFYINGRLVGAIGYGWSFADHFQGLVTPIEEMLEIWNNPEILPSFDPAPLIAEAPPSKDAESRDMPPPRAASADVTSGDAEDAGDVVIEEVLPSSGDVELPAPRDPAVSGDVIPSSADIRASWDILVSRDRAISRDRTISGDAKVKTRGSKGSLFVSGLSARMSDAVTKLLGAEAVPFAGSGGGSRSVRYNPKIKPGMAIGASLLWGDVEVSSIGTLTAVSKDGRFIAYAHPFMSLGPTSSVLMEANISSVIPSVNNSFKLGTTGDIIGIVTQDRPQGIGGRVGRFAPAASVSVNLTDVDSGRSYGKAFQMVQDKYLLSNLAAPAIVGSVESLWGRTGAGSAKVTATFRGGAMREGWKRTNIFVSETDVTGAMLEEFKSLTQLFAVNPFQEIRPFGVNVDVEVTQEPRVLYIEDVKFPKGALKPGDKLTFDITLRPWRKDPFVRTYTLTVPENVSGIAQLLVRGGGIAEETAEYQNQAWRSISSLPILLRELDAKETNDQIVMEIRGQEALEAQINRARSGDPDDLMNDKLKSEQRDEKMQEGSMRVVRTNYYVDGIIHKLIKVDSSDSEDGGDSDEESLDEEDGKTPKSSED